MNPAIQSKLERGEKLTEVEEKEVIASFNSELEKMEKERPEEYLRMLKELTKIITDLDRDVNAILES